MRVQNLRAAATAIMALFLLNTVLAWTNWWPTPFVKLDGRISPEFVLLWVALLVLVALRGPIGRRWVVGLAAVYLVLVLGRYFDTTAPALFARDLKLYWDIPQIPRVVYTTLRSYPVWVSVIAVMVLVALLWALWWVLRWAIATVANVAVPYALKRPWCWVVTVLALGAAVANFLGVQATWPYMSKPALKMYAEQGRLLWATFNERELHKNLPPSPAFDADLALLRGSDVYVMFVESYGQVAFGIPEIDSALTEPRAELVRRIEAQGMNVVSAFVSSTTYGGRSELAHVAFLSGIDTGNPWVHDLLITTERPLLTGLFAQRGYEVHGLYPSLSWDWPEHRFYRFDRFIDARDLGYRGPPLGPWKVPDQFSLASYAQRFPITAQSKPRLVFFTSITSHIPFHPVPPYVEDWAAILRDPPFDAAQLATIAAQKEDWFNMRPSYINMMRYNHQWLGGWVTQPRVRDAVFIVIGDHQPAANVTGEGASWDVPVHIISSKPELLKNFEARGFVRGLIPKPQRVGTIFDLTRIVMDASSSKP